MKTLGYLSLTLLLFACKSNNKSAVADSIIHPISIGSIKPYALNGDYTVIDTGSYGDEGPMTGGRFSVITKNKTLVDTIDLDFGMKTLDDHLYMYQSVRSSPPDPGIKMEKKYLWGNVGDYIVIDNGQKTQLSKLLSDFDRNFSSPTVINKKVYYWHLNSVDSLGALKVSAAQFDPISKQTKRYYLFNDTLQTDNTGYFAAPYIKHDTLYFENEKGNIKKFSKDFKPYN